MREIKHPSDPGTGNKMASKRCGPHGVPGPVSTTGGKDTGPHATNASPIGNLTRPESPTARSHSRNQ